MGNTDEAQLGWGRVSTCIPLFTAGAMQVEAPCHVFSSPHTKMTLKQLSLGALDMQKAMRLSC